MTKIDNYFNDFEYISNSQLRNFRNYNRFWQKLLTPAIYSAYRSWKVKFKVNDNMIIGKAIDLFYDKSSDLFMNKEKLFETYIPVARRTWKNPKWTTEITKTMEEQILSMIEWGSCFDIFLEVLNDKNSECQRILKTEINWMKMKGLPDIINKERKLIVDLKTTVWSIDMITDQLAFKWEPILTSNYITQLWIYNKLAWWGYDGAIALITPKWVKYIEVPNEILEEAWEIIERDVEELVEYIKNPKSINESIFNNDLTL